MSETTDLFVARPSEAPDLASAPPDELVERWEHGSLEGVADPELAALARLLCGSAFTFEPEVLCPLEDPSFGGDVTRDALLGGVYVVRVPDALVDATSRIPDARVGEIAEAWRRASPGLGTRSKAHAVEALLTLRELSALARASDRVLLSVFEI